PAADVAVFRFTPTGQPDPTFDGDGEAVFGSNATPALDQPSGLTIGPDGGIVVLGTIVGAPAQKPDVAPSEITVFRLTPAGQLDPTFGTGGRVQVGVPVNGFNTANPSAVSVGADGFVVLAGSAVIDSYQYSVKGFGFATGTIGEPVVIRLRADGTLDPGFGTGGVVLVPHDPASTFQTFQAVSARPDGRVLVAGLGSDSVGAGGFRGA